MAHGPLLASHRVSVARAAELARKRAYNREYWLRWKARDVSPRRKVPPPAVPVHQVIRTFAPPLAGTIALSFLQYRVIAR